MATATRRRPEPATLPIGDRTINQLAQVFKLLADDSRLRILLTLSREGEMHVSALCAMLGQSQPAVSHHLTLLRMASLVGYRRSGKYNFYRIDGISLGETLDRLFVEAGRGASLSLGDFSLTILRSNRRR